MSYAGATSRALVVVQPKLLRARGSLVIGTDPMFKLVIQDDEGKTTVVPLVRDEITIGRKEGNTIRLTERNVSRRHARIVRSASEVTIEDLGSYNGIRVNNARIAERIQLRVSDQVQIGDYKLFLKAEGLEHVDDAKTVPIERIETATTIDAITAIDPVTPASQPPSAVPSIARMVGNPNQTLVAIADTDPAGRPIASPAVVASLSAPVGHARLVVLSSNFAGSEFELSRPQMIIGRTDENDIVINHRSISRNHAKLVREPDTGRYTVSDLQSSNGVRVNGQDYGKVELRRGDVIDLGHVRMRFVDAGEEYVFTRDAIEDVPEEGRGKGLWVAIALAVVLLGGIGIYFAVGRGDGATPSSPIVKTQNPNVTPAIQAPDAAVVAVAEPDATVAPPTVVPDAGMSVSDEPVKRKRSECVQLQGEERWAELAKCASELRVTKGAAKDDVDAATAFGKQAAIEVGSKKAYDKFNEYLAANNMRDMGTAMQRINKDSLYYRQAHDKWEAEKREFVGGKYASAQRAASKGRCAEMRSLSGEIRNYDKVRADEILKMTCNSPNPTAECNTPDKAAEMQKIVDDIRDGHLDDAVTVRNAEQALNNKCMTDGGKRATLAFLGVTAACRLGNVPKVNWFYTRGGKTGTLLKGCPELLGDPNASSN
jgi:pSer/pThr/pTyr-binding forkhead associated (FHA) protein